MNWARTATPSSVSAAVDAAFETAAPKPKKRYLTAAERIRIINLYRDGMPCKQIAYKVGRPVCTVHYHLRRAIGIDLRFKTARNAELARLWNSGMTATEVGAVLGMEASAVKAMVGLLRKRGFDLERRRHARS